MKPKSIAVIVGVVLVAVLIFQNTHSVVMNVFFWEPDFPLVFLLGIVGLIGYVIGYFFKDIISIIRKKGDDY